MWIENINHATVFNRSLVALFRVTFSDRFTCAEQHYYLVLCRKRLAFALGRMKMEHKSPSAGRKFFASIYIDPFCGVSSPVRLKVSCVCKCVLCPNKEEESWKKQAHNQNALLTQRNLASSINHGPYSSQRHTGAAPAGRSRNAVHDRSPVRVSPPLTCRKYKPSNLNSIEFQSKIKQ